MTYPELKVFIAGSWRSQTNGGLKDVVNPFDESILAQLPLVDVAELEQAATAAHDGYKLWSRKTALERCNVLRKAAQNLRQRAPEIAHIITLEQGKLLSEALREVTLSADIIDFQAEEAKRLYGRTVPVRVAGILSHQVIRQAIGVVAAFTAWNFPVNLPSRKIASALAAGCSIILKAAEETPASAQLLVQCFLDAGLEPLAIQLVFGPPAMVSSTLIAHPLVKKISLTGSVAVGRLLATQCAQQGKKLSSELGGHAPVIICEDANIDFAIQQSIPAKFRNAGQVCASPIRFMVHKRHYEQWLDLFVAQTKKIKLGNGLDPNSQMGPLTHAGRVADIQNFVTDAKQKGAEIVCGGQRLNRPGYFFEPTVITQAPNHSRVMQEEPFGPIALIQPFEDLTQAIQMANSLPYALGAYAFTKDLETAHILGEQLEAGMVGINHYGVSQPELPFGGWKDSGNAQEMGSEGLLHYTELKTITVGVPR